MIDDSFTSVFCFASFWKRERHLDTTCLCDGIPSVLFFISVHHFFLSSLRWFIQFRHIHRLNQNRELIYPNGFAFNGQRCDRITDSISYGHHHPLHLCIILIQSVVSLSKCVYISPLLIKSPKEGCMYSLCRNRPFSLPALFTLSELSLQHPQYV